MTPLVSTLVLTAAFISLGYSCELHTHTNSYTLGSSRMVVREQKHYIECVCWCGAEGGSYAVQPEFSTGNSLRKVPIIFSTSQAHYIFHKCTATMQTILLSHKPLSSKYTIIVQSTPSPQAPHKALVSPVTVERCTREGAPRLVSTPLTHSALASDHSGCGVIWTMDSGWSSRNERMEKSTSTGDGRSMSMGLVTPNGNTGWV